MLASAQGKALTIIFRQLATATGASGGVIGQSNQAYGDIFVSKYQRLCLFTLLGSTLALPIQAIDNEQPGASYHQDDIAAMRSELQSLEASVGRLENRLASIERQQRVPTKNGTLPVHDSTASRDLEKAIQALLQDVTEQ
mgnify:CR=1 FL=1